MADLILEPIWNWLSQLWGSMADLADRIDDLICSFEGGGDTTMDTVAMLMFGWMIFGLCVLAIGRYVYGRFLSAPAGAAADKPAAAVSAAASAVAASDEAKEAHPKPVVVPPRAAAVPPTPPVRKRLSTKKGSGAASAGPLRPSVAPPPIATGPDSECVQWVNDIFYWLYTDLVIVNEILNVWIHSLNEFCKKSVAEHGVGVEFVRILPETHAPTLANVFCECDSKDDVTVTCDCEATPAFQLKAFRQKGEKVEVSHYRVNVNRFRARLNVVCITEKLLADVKCDGWPDIKVALAQVGSIKSNLDEQQLQDVISEIVVTALRSTMVNLNLSVYPTCPRFVRQTAEVGPILPVHYDSLMASQYPSNLTKTAAEKRLLIKIIKATGLGAKQGCTEPYCVVEMDDPPQKNQTSIKKDTNSPVWDEHFLFDLSPNTAELLFEIYDRVNKGKKFLGLGIVGMEELLINPSQRQVITLQSRPYEKDEVSGTLTVEFLFIEGPDIPLLGDKPYKLKETLRTVSPSGGVITTTKTVFSRPDTQENLTNGGEAVTDSALKELEMRNRTGPTQTSKSTLIIHSVQREPQHRQLVKVEQTDTGRWHEVADEQGTKETAALPPSGQDGMQTTTPTSTLTDDRGRSRRKKRDFFGTIKRRLGRSKTRSKSVDPGERDDSLNRDASINRSISADRARDPSAHSTGYLSVPGLRGIDGNSTRSSLSEASGVSGASTRTYVNEASTLVLETIENGVKKHYLVPLSMAQKSKWRKKGTKLHIFNDHTFIAKHLQGGTVCEVCKKTIARRLGKQGYECRDCQLKCHKHCHVKVDTNCTSSTIQNIELAYLSSPYMDRRVFQLKNGWS
ncbi:phospholipid transfer protein C2CD2L isoform X1 [Schistocerca cancellata]|uniref:phospholipid transfer protein C2CD2L isoform X1 n=1 Tax=Schistocerca cancellata TaxID=274614 RepID=UPI00211937EC|nr:phospholipid transfer protein C2CD2L isoform X1 [Schistocerca cancellata]